MAVLTPFPQRSRPGQRRSVRPAMLRSGFTLPELLIAAALGTGIALLTGEALVTHARSSARAESLQRQRDDWYRATSFIESEIAMSERVCPDSSCVEIDPACPFTPSEVRLSLDISRNLPPILYGVKDRSSLPASQRDQWLGDRVLMRCGPAIGTGAGGANGGSSYDDYLPGTPLGTPVASVLIDALDGTPCNAKGHLGFCVNTPTVKSASFTLALQGVKTTTSPAYRFGSGSHSRINPVNAFPQALSECDRVCTRVVNGEKICNSSYVYQGKPRTGSPESGFPDTITAGNNGEGVIICGLGGSATAGDVLSSFDGQDVIDAGFYGGAGARINGGNGRNFLYGTIGSDTLQGGADDDTLVGRCGADLMVGGNGNNSYLPWQGTGCASGTTLITGGENTDVVYLNGNSSDYSAVSCSGTTCSINQGTTKLTMTNVEVLVFRNKRQDL